MDIMVALFKTEEKPQTHVFERHFKKGLFFKEIRQFFYMFLKLLCRMKVLLLLFVLFVIFVYFTSNKHGFSMTIIIKF